MICPYCGEELKDTAKFCTNCGQKQPAAEPEAEETAAWTEPKPEESAAEQEEAEAGESAEEGSEAAAVETPETVTEDTADAMEAETTAAETESLASGTLTAGDVICALLSIIMLLWINRLFGILALIFAVRAYVKRRSGDEEKAQNSRKICVILLLVGIGLLIIGKILKLIFKIGAIGTIFSWVTRGLL